MHYDLLQFLELKQLTFFGKQCPNCQQQSLEQSSDLAVMLKPCKNDKSNDIITRQKKKKRKGLWTKHIHVKVVSRNYHILAAPEMNRCGQGWLTCEHKCAHNGHRMLPSSFLPSCFIGYSLLTWAQGKTCAHTALLPPKSHAGFYCLLPSSLSFSCAQTVQQCAPSLEPLVSHVTHIQPVLHCVFSGTN